MLLIRSSLVPPELAVEPIGVVGIWSIYDDADEPELAGLPIKKVPDEVKYPLAYESDQSNPSWLEKFEVIAGPCSAESERQITETATFLASLGVKYFRAGCFKPRTNAYSFQGMGEEGLKLCRQVCDSLDMKFVSEVKDVTNVELVSEYADVVQVGSKCMYDVGVLTFLGKTSRDILLKRHFGATLKEFAQAADFIMCQGNESVMLCERGIRTFEASTRFTLDSCGIEWLKRNTNLKIIGDPSHAMGLAYGVPSLGYSMIAQKVDGLIVEVHPDPPHAKSDASQQITYDEFRAFYGKALKLQRYIEENI